MLSGDRVSLVDSFVSALRGIPWWLSLLSALVFTLVSTAAGMAALLRLAPDHFVQDELPSRSLLVSVLRNLVAWPTMALGVVLMLPLVPGPGLLFFLIGLSLASFPGKKKIQSRLVARAGVRAALNRLRTRFDRPPFVFD